MIPGADNELARMVGNLVDNAARHAETAVRIALTTTERHRAPDRRRRRPRHPRGDRERIFERFTRLDDSRARDNGGSGLGLAVVRSIATRHRGHVWVEDSPTGGARFIVELPAGSRHA